MAWVAVAAIGIGAYQADKAQRRMDAANAREFELLQKQYDDWQAVYGPIQNQLSRFYSGLSPEAFAASGIQAYEKEFQTNQENIQRSFAQRGIDSAAQEQITSEAGLTAAEAKAKIRTEAPLRVAEAKQGFLSSATQNPNANRMADYFGQVAEGQANLVNAGQNLVVQGGLDLVRQYGYDRSKNLDPNASPYPSQSTIDRRIADLGNTTVTPGYSR